jgi:hypothetical protein
MKKMDLQTVNPRLALREIRWRRTSAANIGPNRFHQCRTVAWQIRPALEQQIFDVPQREEGKRTYIITTRRMISGEELKQRNGLASLRERGIILPCLPNSAFALTLPLFAIRQESACHPENSDSSQQDHRAGVGIGLYKDMRGDRYAQN